MKNKSNFPWFLVSFLSGTVIAGAVLSVMIYTAITLTIDYYETQKTEQVLDWQTRRQIEES